MTYLDNLLRRSPRLLSAYVSVATTLVDKTLTPLNSLMRHVLVIQGIDPNTSPGDRLKKQVQQAIDKVDDFEEYEEDYDFSWVERQRKQAVAKLDDLNLTQERFRELTNLSKLDDSTHEVKIVAPDTVKFEIKPASEVSLTVNDLKKALGDMTKIAARLEKSDKLPVKKRVVSKSRTSSQVGRSKTIKKSEKEQTKFKGVFRRS